MNGVRAQLWMTYPAVTINDNTPVVHNKDTWKRVATCNILTRMRASARTNATTPCYIYIYIHLCGQTRPPHKNYTSHKRVVSTRTRGAGPAALPSDGLEQAHLSAGNRRPMCVPGSVRAVNR